MANQTKGNKKKVERNDPIKKENLKKSIEEYTDIFTTCLNNYLVKSYSKETDEKGKKNKYTDLYKNTGIPKTSFTNYQTSRIPRYTETLIMIKDYLDLPFSYLFGETLTTNINESDIDISMAYGLNDKSMSNLKKIKMQLEDNPDSEKINAYAKLLLLNTLICDNDFLDSLVNLFLKLMEKEKVEESLKNIKHHISDYDNDYIDYLKYVSYEKFIQSINKLVETEKNKN